MLDIRLIREQTDFVKAELGKAGVEEAEIDRILECDAERRRLQRELDEMRARRTRESKELGRMAPAERESRSGLEMRELGDQISAGEQKLAEVERRFIDLMLGHPQSSAILRADRPWARPTTKSSAAKASRASSTSSRVPHWEIGEKLGIIDFERGVKLSGTRFYVLKGLGARLERALIAFMLELKTRRTGLSRNCAAADGQYGDGDQHRPSAEKRRHDVSRYRRGLLVYPDGRTAADQPVSRRDPR